TKNPFHKDLRVTFWTEQAYKLDYLADFVELPNKLSKEQEVLGLVRNCIMFDTVRKWAYKAIIAHRGSTFYVWLFEVLKQFKNVNNAYLYQ
ncbi:plasmid replicase, partial [Acinetobacter junii]